jgi:hypothetical protein
MEVLDVGWEHFHFRDLEFFDRVNLLKGGVAHATLLNTVSPSYAREIRTPDFAYGIDGAVRDRGDDLTGILNGADYEEWNPESDGRIAAAYSEQDPSNKALCKEDLQRELGLPPRAGVPLYGVVSRLVKQKGIDRWPRPWSAFSGWISSLSSWARGSRGPGRFSTAWPGAARRHSAAASGTTTGWPTRSSRGPIFSSCRRDSSPAALRRCMRCGTEPCRSCGQREG